MIYVDRSGVPFPASLFHRGVEGYTSKEHKNSIAEIEYKAAEKFFAAENREANSQKHFQFSAYRSTDVHDALARLFHGKCAYCETKFLNIDDSAPPTDSPYHESTATFDSADITWIDDANMILDVEHFRPKSGVVESPAHPGYWWLAMRWENLLLTCADCNRTRERESIKTGKGNRFPLEKEENRVFDHTVDMKTEKPLLLDPCDDYPVDHLVFDEKTGMLLGFSDRGTATIAVLDLNRPTLVAKRHAAIQEIGGALKEYYDATAATDTNKKRLKAARATIDKLRHPSEEFSALKNQLTEPFMDGVMGPRVRKVMENLGITIQRQNQSPTTGIVAGGATVTLGKKASKAFQTGSYKEKVAALKARVEKLDDPNATAEDVKQLVNTMLIELAIVAKKTPIDKQVQKLLPAITSEVERIERISQKPNIAADAVTHTTVQHMLQTLKIEIGKLVAVPLTAKFEREQAAYTLNNDDGISTFLFQRRLIEHVEITNIKAIETLRLELTSQSGRTPWLMLLGENGTGKSTVLQMTALTLLGSDYFAELAKSAGLHAKDFIRDKKESGRVSVKLSGFPKPHELFFYPDRVEFSGPTGEKCTIHCEGDQPGRVEGKGWQPQMLLLGYGATRLLPRAGTRRRNAKSSNFSRVDNLFDPFVPLIDAEKWLLRKSLSDDSFNNIAQIIKNLLSMPEKAKLVRDNGKITVHLHSNEFPLRRFSDGYQSMVATTVDILEVAFRLWPKPTEAEGIILLDELGAHLHPELKMKVAVTLRQALPGMQFLVTTHDPLCLRGLGNGEVAVMQRDKKDRVVAITDLPSPEGMRADQLLTSEYFGLNSTVDPDIQAKRNEYNRLNLLASPTTEEISARDQLAADLKRFRYLGDTPREQAIYDAMDQVVEERKSNPTIAMADVRQSAIDKVRAIWSAPATTGEGAAQ